MNTPRESLERECSTFVRYLTGSRPSPYVVTKYLQAHEVLPAMEDIGFGDTLVRIASRSSAWTLLADSFARLFVPRGSLRKKLVLLIAILEVSPPFSHDLIGPPAHSRVTQLVFLTGRFMLFGLALAAGAIVFLPLRLLTPRSKRVTP
jgi:hypothetical protein